MLAVRERGGGTAEEVRLAIGLEAVPVVGDARLRTFEADVIRDPIAVSDDLAPNRLVPDLPCRARDLVDPSGPCGGRVEVEENVVRRRPQRPAWSREGEAALETTDRAQLVRQLDQARKRDGETAAHLQHLTPDRVRIVGAEDRALHPRLRPERRCDDRRSRGHGDDQPCRAGGAMREVSQAEARRIAVRTQLLDGSALGILDVVRRAGALQIDPISTVAPPQHLVLWSRLGAFDRGELDRLLWEERKLFEWGAFIWPIEDYPLIRARMRRRRGSAMYERRGAEFLKRNARFRRYVLRELETRGPLLSREIEDHASMRREHHVWWGSRKMGLMLELLSGRGEVAIVGRRNGQRLWDLAERWYPETDAKLSWPEAERLLEERRVRGGGGRPRQGR